MLSNKRYNGGERLEEMRELDERRQQADRERALLTRFSEVKIWLMAGSAVVSTLVATLLLLHTFGVFGYESRISVLEAAVMRIDKNVEDLRNAFLPREEKKP